MSKLITVRPRTVGIMLFAAIVVLFVSTLGTAFATTGHAAAGSSVLSGDQCGLGGPGCHHIGVTDGWYEGKTVDFLYSHDYFCKEPPSSGATSSCELGADALTNPPSGPIVSPLYVLVPLGFTPDPSTLQCPVAGRCIDHPRTIDLSRVFGQGTENAALPPHSHVIGDEEKFRSAWWPVEVVGVNNLGAWNAIVAAKSLDQVRAEQQEGDATADIGTNLFLFFQVVKGAN
jgi:hypothetical protein